MDKTIYLDSKNFQAFKTLQTRYLNGLTYYYEQGQIGDPKSLDQQRKAAERIIMIANEIEALIGRSITDWEFDKGLILGIREDDGAQKASNEAVL